MSVLLVLLESALLYVLRFLSSPEGIALIDGWETDLEARIASGGVDTTPPQPSATRNTARNSAEGIVNP